MKRKTIIIIIVASVIILSIAAYFIFRKPKQAIKEIEQPKVPQVPGAVSNVISLNPAAVSYPLAYGMKGTEILTLQKAINKMQKMAGAKPVAEDSVYGRETEAAIMARFGSRVMPVNKTNYNTIISTANSQ